MAYIHVTLNHFRAVKAWAEAHGAQAHLDMVSHALEITAQGRTVKLLPQFMSRLDGRTSYVPTLRPDVCGFIGWMPYRLLQFPFGRDKLVFKRLLREAGLATPDSWTSAKDATADYVLKTSIGSFGYQVYGPYRCSSTEGAAEAASSPMWGQRYAERFVRGRNLKMWFWDETPFHAHLHDYPAVVGDGVQTVAQLLAPRVDLATHPELPALEQLLAYQGLMRDEVVAAGRQVWLDIRYGRRFPPDGPTAVDDNDLEALSPAARSQALAIGKVIGARVRPLREGPILYALDGVVDEAGTVWWLELNSNPILPPSGYEPMLARLFAAADVAWAAADVARGAP